MTPIFLFPMIVLVIQGRGELLTYMNFKSVLFIWKISWESLLRLYWICTIWWGYCHYYDINLSNQWAVDTFLFCVLFYFLISILWGFFLYRTFTSLIKLNLRSWFYEIKLEIEFLWISLFNLIICIYKIHQLLSIIVLSFSNSNSLISWTTWMSMSLFCQTAMASTFSTTLNKNEECWQSFLVPDLRVKGF